MSSSDIEVVKANGQREPFVKEKLESSLFKAGADETTVNDIVDHTVRDLKDGMSTSEIYKHAFFLLRQKSKPAAVTYSLRRAVMGLGPSGFPFEKYVSLILKEKGYEVLTDQMVMGSCVPHEVDIIAWNENKLIMVEAKFHN